MPGKVTRSVLIVRFGTVTQCFVILFSFLPAFMLSAAFCNALIQVDKLPDATQILASNQQQQKPPNSTESFEGLDYETHFLTESYPDKAIVRFWNYWPTINANDTDSSVFTCEVISPLIIAEHVYLQIFMDNNSSKIFTGGRTRAKTESNQGNVNISDSDFRWWRGEEYQFDIHFTTNMSRAACLGIDTNGTWRRNEDTIKFYWGTYMLECSFELRWHPNPEISWELPSGTKSDRPCLWFSNISSDSAGQYTCTAKNKYGNGTYSYKVNLRDPTFLERLNTRMGNLLVIILRPIAGPLGIFLVPTGIVPFPGDSAIKHFSCSWINYVD